MTLQSHYHKGIPLWILDSSDISIVLDVYNYYATIPNYRLGYVINNDFISWKCFNLITMSEDYYPFGSEISNLLLERQNVTYKKEFEAFKIKYASYS